jgi:lipid II:glycine glycyltransferase (peptidoglycan interpeptide bridge formation enzyme)
MCGVQRQVITSADEWDKAVSSLPDAHVLQSWAWGEIKARHGWTPKRVLFCINGVPAAGAQTLRRRVPRTPYGVLYVPKGPALDYENTALFAAILGEIEQMARQERAIFVKVDPDIRTSQAAAAVLEKRGWIVSAEQIQFHNTVTLDIGRTEQEILDAMKPKWRYNIRLAEKKGVYVIVGDEGALETFYEMYAETSARDNFLIRSFAYYKDVWETMLRAGRARVLLAKVGDETVAGLVLFWYGRRAWYFYGASMNSHRDLMPNHLLQWRAMQLSRELGCTEYDFWGAPDVLEESAPMYGVYKFKMGFGGEFVERIPAHDFVVNRALYWLYAVVRPRYLARMRRNSVPGD